MSVSYSMQQRLHISPTRLQFEIDDNDHTENVFEHSQSHYDDAQEKDCHDGAAEVSDGNDHAFGHPNNLIGSKKAKKIMKIQVCSAMNYGCKVTHNL